MTTTYHTATDRFSGRCETCIYPIVTESADHAGDFMPVTCPGCGASVRLERLYGAWTDTNCDARCQYALGSMCGCSCGGANHQRGYIPPVAGGEVPAGVLARYRRTHAARRDAADRRRTARAEDRAASVAAAAATFVDGIMADDDMTLTALALLPDTDLAVSFIGLDDYAITTITDIRAKLYANGSLSDRQVEFVGSLITRGEQRARWAAERAAERSADAPTGRVTFEGVVVKRAYHETDFGGSYKLTIKVTNDDGAVWRVWVTEPSAIMADVGDVVRMTATVTPSDNDPSFAFGKRPSKATLVTVEPVAV